MITPVPGSKGKWLVCLMALLLGSFENAWCQTIFWNENFNNGCASGCLASTYGGWSVVDNVNGVSGGSPNNWFVSCAEEGVTPPGCGSSCIGDASLHLGADPAAGGDMGATYNETGATNATYKLAVSPTISTVGYSTITLNFDFIAFGSSGCTDDRAQLRLSTDNGATWPLGYQFCLTTVCCGACNGYSQGQWTTYVLALPAAFNNNPNVRIGFHWRNNGNGSGTDPSVAIDDIRLSVAVLPLTLLDFTARPENKKVKLNWTSTDEVNVHHFDVERSDNFKKFYKVGNVPAKGNATAGSNKYAFEDAQKNAKTIYYRLKMVDQDGSFKYSSIISVDTDGSGIATLEFGNIAGNNGSLDLKLTTTDNLNANVDIYDLQGKKMVSLQNQHFAKGENKFALNVSGLKSSVYIINIKSDDTSVDISKKFFKTE